MVYWCEMNVCTTFQFRPKNIYYNTQLIVLIFLVLERYIILSYAFVYCIDRGRDYYNIQKFRNRNT